MTAMHLLGYVWLAAAITFIALLSLIGALAAIDAFTRFYSVCPSCTRRFYGRKSRTVERRLRSHMRKH